MKAKFGAPWCGALKVITCLAVALLIAIMMTDALLMPRGVGAVRWIAVGVPVAILLCSTLFVIRGYEIVDRTLLIRRLFWTTRIDLASFSSAAADPQATKGSIRLFGNGGLFVIAGWFSNQQLGRYRAFSTDPKRAVVLRFVERVIVVTPDDPQAFVIAITKRQ